MKNNTTFKLITIFLIALLFRVYMLDKPEGLWNDEYMGWYIASKQSFSDFFNQIFRNCHMPLYFIYLKIWIFFFGDKDIILRLSSVVPSLISIYAMYKIGLEIKDKKTGLFIAFLTTISSFHIYFAQEMRLYSLIFLFSALETLYFIKVIKEQTKKNLSLFFTYNILICATHTLGIIFSTFNIIAILYYIFKTKKEDINLKKIILSYSKQLIPFILCLIILLPLMHKIVFTPSLSQFWSEFNIQKILFLFTDYFSPIQINIVSQPTTFIDVVYIYKQINWHYILLGIFPTIIAMYCIFNSINEKNTPLKYLLLCAGLYLVSLIFLSASGRIILLTKYSIEIYPILLTAVASGFMCIKKEKLKYILTFTFIFINLLYLIFASNSAQKITRTEGHKAPIQLIENSKLNYDDQVIFTFFSIDKFEKYIGNMDKYKLSSIHKYNFTDIMFENNQNKQYFDYIKNGKEQYRSYFQEFPNEFIINNIKNQYINNMKSGERIGIIYLKNISVHKEKTLAKIVNDDKAYKHSHFIFIAFSYLLNNILYTFDQNLELESMKKSGDWILLVYVKK